MKNYLDLEQKIRAPIPIPLVACCFVLICFLAWLWGFKTSGVLENTMTYQFYPMGYSYILNSPDFGLWPVNRESLYYLNGMLAFLSQPDAIFNIGNGYELTRTLYCLLLRSFWFLEPIVASLVLDIILWFLAAISAAFVAATISKNRMAPWIAALLVVFGQGFLHSVGEGMPHVAGYAGGFYIAAIICFFRTWQKECLLSQDLTVYLFIALWQFAYGTALFFLPLALICSYMRFNKLGYSFIKSIFLLCTFGLMSLLPFLIVTAVLRFFIPYPGELKIVLSAMKENYPDLSSYLFAYCKVFLDAMISLGPIITFSFLSLIWLAAIKRYKDMLIILAIFLIQYSAMVFMITPLSGRGYATYNLALIPTILFALMFSRLPLHKSKRVAVPIFLIMMLYPNAMKLGYRLPNKAFQMGWFTATNSKWQTYELHQFE